MIGGTLSLGTMLAMSMLATSLFGPLERLVPSLVPSLMQIVAIRIYTERIDEVRQAKPEQDPDVALDAPVLAGGVS